MRAGALGSTRQTRALVAFGILATISALPAIALAQSTAALETQLVRHWTAWLALGAFAIGYTLVVLEERTRLKKSIPMILTSGVLWVLVSISPVMPEIVRDRLQHHVLEFAELFLFILAAVTFVNTMEERQVFDAVRVWLIRRGLTLRGIFWVTGAMAFVMSPVADNLTTTLVIGAVTLSMGQGVVTFVVPACINIVVAANAGGAFSPFGDITTLMVWQSGKLEFGEFLQLGFPALVNWLVPALIMSSTLPKEKPSTTAADVGTKAGANVVIALFIATIAATVFLHNGLHIPAAVGMMSGLGALQLYGYFLRRTLASQHEDSVDGMLGGFEGEEGPDSFDIFHLLARVEWDTLMFFYGVILCVGALGVFGFLDASATATYGAWGPTWANVVVGIASAVFDNIPLMAAVLLVSPEMDHSQWLLITLTTGVGGSLLSLGSAAGVALMGQAKGVYTFTAHLKWTWAIALGYAAAIGTHLVLNGR